METADKVKVFKADLKDGKKPKVFNIWAFIFSSFYFLYVEMFWFFALFLILPFIINIPFARMVGLETGFIISFIISHIIAGFVANPYYRKYKEKFVSHHENLNKNAKVEYFAISLPRLVISTILSGGLYTIYWGYKNWNNYQKATNDDVNPYLRGWFFNWTAIPLFDKIRYSTQSAKSYAFYGLACLLVFIAESVISYGISKNLISENMVFASILALFFLMLIYPFFIVPVQVSINKHTTEVLKKPLNKRFYPWEIVILVLGIVLNFYNWFGNPFTSDTAMPEPSDEKITKIETSIGFIYRHTKGYSEVCKQEGYIITEYPNKFNEFFSQEISALNSELAKYKYTLERAERELISLELDEYMKKNIYEELEQFRKMLIIETVAKEYNIPPKDVIWQESYDSALTIKDVCEFFDKNGINLLKNGKNKDFLKLNAL